MRKQMKWMPPALWTNSQTGLQWERAIAASTDQFQKAFHADLTRVPCALDALVALWLVCTSCSDSPGKPAPVLRPGRAELSGPILLCSRESLQVVAPFLFSPTAKSCPQLPSGCTLCPPSASDEQTAGDSLQISPLRSANFLRATPTDGWAKDNGPSLYRTAGLKGKSCRKKLDPVRCNPTGRGLFKSALPVSVTGPNHRFNTVGVTVMKSRTRVMQIMQIRLFYM